MADVCPSPGHHVWGALYEIDAAGLAALDTYEIYDPQGAAEENAYIRRPVEVITPEGHRHPAVWCYFVRQPRAHVEPSLLYRRALLEGAQERQLPPDYLATLDKLLLPDTETRTPLRATLRRAAKRRGR